MTGNVLLTTTTAEEKRKDLAWGGGRGRRVPDLDSHDESSPKTKLIIRANQKVHSTAYLAQRPRGQDAGQGCYRVGYILL